MSSGGTERICQNAASPDRPRMRSCQALPRVFPSTSSGTRSAAGQAARRPVGWTAGRSSGTGAAGRTASWPPARAGDPEGRTVLTGPVCTPDAHRASGQGWDARAFPLAGEPSGGGPRRATTGAAVRADRRTTSPGGRRSRRGGAVGGRRIRRGRDAVDDRLGDVVGVELLAADLRAGLRVLEDAGDGDVEPRGARLRDAVAVVRLVLDGGLGDVAPLPAHRLDVVVLRAPEGDGDGPAGGPLGLHVDAGVGVVLPGQVDQPVEDGGLATGRVSADVEAVRLVVDVLEAGEEDGVEHRRRELADAAPDRLGQLAALDHVGRDVALRGPARPR